MSRVRADYDRSKIFVGTAGFKEKAAILDALKIKDMDSDDLLDHVRVHYGIEDTEAVGIAIDVLLQGNYLVMYNSHLVGKKVQALNEMLMSCFV